MVSQNINSRNEYKESVNENKINKSENESENSDFDLYDLQKLRQEFHSNPLIGYLNINSLKA